MTALLLGTRPTISVGGSQVAASVNPDVIEVTVDSDATGPDMCVITLADDARDVFDRMNAEFHATLKIEIAPPGEDAAETLFEGKIYGLEMTAESDIGVRSRVIGYDGTYALRDGLVTATYNNVTDSDLASQLASDAGLTIGEVESTSVVHEHVSQVNETLWNFLERRARANNLELSVTGDQLNFRPSPDSSDAPSPGGHASRDPLQLTVGGNLQSFHGRASAAQQVTEVEVRGWDPSAKSAISATARAETTSSGLAIGSAADVAGQDGSPRFVRTEARLGQQAQVDALATAEAERIASTFAYAEGVAIGDPRLRAGTAVSVGQSGRFDGQYTITRAVHRHSTETGYLTTFTVSGRHDRSLYGLTGSAAASTAGSFPGVYQGLVTNLDDPQALGRVKLKLPWLGEDYETDWARVMQIGAGSERGILWFPEINDEVLISFISGDPAYPIVVGGLFNGEDQPPISDHLDTTAGEVNKRCLKTRAGSVLEFDDTSGSETIRLATPDEEVSIKLDQGSGTITIESPKDIVVNAGGKADITTQSDLSFEVAGSASFKANGGLKLESSGQVEIKGAVIKLN